MLGLIVSLLTPAGVAFAAVSANPDSYTVEAGLSRLLHPEENDGVGYSNAFTVKVTSPPSHGTATRTLDSVGNYLGVTYKPAAGYRGPDSFTYSITKSGATTSAVVQLTVDRQGPTSAQAETRWQGAFVEWTNPASPEVADPVLAYQAGTEALASPSDGTVVPGVDGYESAAFVTGLTNYTTYTLTLFSQYADGEVVPGESVTVEPGIEAPRGLRGAGMNGSVRLDWVVPQGADELVVSWSDSTIHNVTLPAAATTYTVNGLTNGDSIYFTVTAVGYSGDPNIADHDNSAEVEGIPSSRGNTAPVATSPTYPYVPGQEFEASLDGLAFNDANGDDLTVYDWTQPSSGVVTGCGIVLGCLFQPDAANPTTTTFTVSVADGHGGTATATLTMRPRDVTASDDTFTVAAGSYVYLDVLKNDLGLEAGDFASCLRPLTVDNCVAERHNGIEMLRVRVLKARSAYLTYKVVTNWGQAADVARVAVNAVAGPPGPPAIGRAVSGAKGGKVNATAKWSAPSSTGGSAVTGYRVEAQRLNASGAVVARYSATVSASARSRTMKLPVGRCTFRVRAINGKGSGPWSANSNIVRAR